MNNTQKLLKNRLIDGGKTNKMKTKCILVIEDDKEINSLLCRVFAEVGYDTKSAFNGLDGVNIALTQEFQVILIDLMLPFKSGEEVLRQLRENSNAPVIILSAKDTVHTKIDLLRLGADDYITKPFDIDEVIVRVETVLRRYNSNEIPNILSYEDIMIDCNSKRISVSEKDVAFTAMEYSILELLIKNPTKIFSKRNLFENISGNKYLSDDNTINVHISNIRHKLREVGQQDIYIETVYGMGYRLVKN